METIDQICLNTAEFKVTELSWQIIKCFSMFAFMTDILSIMKTLLLVLQKEGALLVSIQCSVDLTLEKFCKLTEADSPDKYTDILVSPKSYYAAYQEYIDILTDLGET